MRRSLLCVGLGASLFAVLPLLAQQPPAARGGFRGGTTVKPGEACPPGTTEIRPSNCMAPEGTVPSIVDYRPVSTLKAPVHMKPKAKFPAIDFHGHPGSLVGSAQSLAALEQSMDSLNLRMMIVAENVSGARIPQIMSLVNASPTMKNRVRVLAGINFNSVGPGWAAKAVAQLEADAAAGAVGVGEISKGLGLNYRKADGSRLKIDDPELDPVWAACARLKLPVFIHTADPQEFWQPVDNDNERWLELSLFPNRRYGGPGEPTFEQLMTERDNVFRKHRNTIFVAAHLGWHANDLGRLGKMMTEMPNVYGEIGAVLYDIGRQPRAARDFFVQFQDRLLFGKDSFQPAEYPYYWRVLETKDDYFDYYRDYHAFWKLYGLDLPDTVLKKVYYQNALKIMPAVPKAGFPQ